MRLPPTPASSQDIPCHSHTARRGARPYILAALECRLKVHLRIIPWMSLGSVGQIQATDTLLRGKSPISVPEASGHKEKSPSRT
jgi:hypothetical protein